jgi:hypothetical protein
MSRSSYIAAGLASGEVVAHRLLRTVAAVAVVILVYIITNGS